MLLTIEEIINLLNDYLTSGIENRHVFGHSVAKAQLKKVFEILGGYQIDMGRGDVDNFPMVYLRILKNDWKSLLKEVE